LEVARFKLFPLITDLSVGVFLDFCVENSLLTPVSSEVAAQNEGGRMGDEGNSP